MGLTNTAQKNAGKKAGLEDFCFYDLRHTWVAWHRRAGASYDELKDLGGWKSSNMVDRYVKFATENLAFAASRIETEKDRKVIKDDNQSYKPANFELIGSPKRINLGNGLLSHASIWIRRDSDDDIVPPCKRFEDNDDVSGC